MSLLLLLRGSGAPIVLTGNWGGLTATATGTLVRPTHSGTMSGSWGGLTAAATGISSRPTRSGTMSATWGPLTASTTGIRTPNLEGGWGGWTGEVFPDGTYNFIPTTTPWYNGTVASTEGLGFYIEEWTGLDGALHGRSVTGIGASRGGARFGPQSSSHRVMKINVMLIGKTDRGLNYLFRWLEQTLLTTCGPCGSKELWVREFCPENAITNRNEGLAQLGDVVLLEGPTWEAPPADDAACRIRRASFTLAAGDPCMYRREEFLRGVSNISTASYLMPAGQAEDFVAACNTYEGTSLRFCQTLVAPDYGVVAPLIRLTSRPEYKADGRRKALPDLRIAGYADPGNVGCDPCGNPIQGEIILSGSETSGLAISVDLARRKVTYTDPYGMRTTEDGSRFIARGVRPGVKRWWALDQCSIGQVLVEPVYMGMYSSSDQTADTASGWSIEAYQTVRFGCV